MCIRDSGISIAYLHDSFTKGRFNLLYENTAAMAADIYTKAFTDGEKWKWACELINIVHKDRLRDLVPHTPTLLPRKTRQPQANNYALTNASWTSRSPHRH